MTARARRPPGQLGGEPEVGLDLRLLVPALVAWALGAAMLGAGPWWRAATGVSALAVAGVLVRLRGARRRGRRGRRRATSRLTGRGGAGRVLLPVAATGLVLLASGAHGLVRHAGPVDELARAHAAVSLVGRVVTEPVSRPARDGGEQVSLTLAVSEVVGRGERTRVRSRVLLMADERWGEAAWQSQVRVSGTLVPADAADPFVALVRVRGGPEQVGEPGLVARGAEHLRAGLRAACRHLPADARGLLPALVIGDTSNTPPDLEEAMLATGMTHLSAVSGSNVAVVLAAALGAGMLVGLRRRWRPWLAMLVLAGFVVLARPEPSVLRAAVMGGVGLIGLSASRRAAGLPVLSSAVLLLLVWDPWLARTFGFALSTLATLGLLLFVRQWGAVIGARLPPRLRGAGPALAIPVAAQVMCAPVVVLLQGSVSVVGIPANLLAAPLVAPATVCGVAAALVAPVLPPVATALAWAGGLPALGIAQVARRFADVPGGTLPWPDGATGAYLLTGVTVLVLLMWRWGAYQARVRPVLVASVAVLGVAATAPTSATTWPPPGWRMVVCDVGQGDAIVLSTGPGRAVLVDAGPDPPLVDGCLTRLGIRTLDAVVLTHFHADHVDGLPGALAGRHVGEVLVSPIAEPAHQVQEVRAWAAEAGAPVREVYAGDRLDWGRLTASVWWPARRISAGSAPNNGSVVLAVHDGPVDGLLLGDVERESARAILMSLRRDPQMATVARGFDVVKTPHHGSANLDAELMEAVRAPVGIISVGEDNDYGHPAPAHLALLRRLGYAVARTDQRGDIAVVAEGDEAAIAWRG